MIFGEDDGQTPSPGHQQQQKVRLDPSRMETLYANFVAIAGSADEVVLYLGANSLLPGQKEPLVQLQQRVIMLPSNAKRLMLALQQTIAAHEDRFGPIEVPPPPRRPEQ